MLLLILTEVWKVLQDFGTTLEFHKSFGPHFIQCRLGFAKILYIEAGSNLDGHQTRLVDWYRGYGATTPCALRT
jgi:hypothetical protein